MSRQLSYCSDSVVLAVIVAIYADLVLQYLQAQQEKLNIYRLGKVMRNTKAMVHGILRQFYSTHTLISSAPICFSKVVFKALFGNLGPPFFPHAGCGPLHFVTLQRLILLSGFLE